MFLYFKVGGKNSVVVFRTSFLCCTGLSRSSTVLTEHPLLTATCLYTSI